MLGSEASACDVSEKTENDLHTCGNECPSLAGTQNAWRNGETCS